LAFDALVSAMEVRARSERTSLLAIKDVTAPADATIGKVLARRGYARLSGLPIASLDLGGVSTLDDYLARLSAATRKDLRRKLRSAATVRIEDCHDVAAYAAQIAELYESTRAESGFDYGEFEKLPRDYFLRVSQGLRERALFKLYWVGDTLAAFNLLLVEPDRLIDKFLGMRYPLARNHDLYALSWLENVRHCIAHGVRALQTGQTAYREKLRMGSRLVPTSIWFRHRGAVAQRVLRTFAPLASFERNDPQLAAACVRHTA
jgi:predicted N-acyltransferase